MKPFSQSGRALTAAVVVSLLFHFSAVSLFRIVVYFPRYNVEYFDVSIVETPITVPALPIADSGLKVPSTGFGKTLPNTELLVSAPALRTELPEIQLPTVKFDELDVLRMRREAVETRTRYTEFFQDQPGDSWALFGEKLTTVGTVISRLTQGEPERVEARAPMPISRPAPGYEIYLEWLSAPYDRQTLAVQPIDALWGMNPLDFGGPVALVFRVNRAGEVIDVLDPIQDASPLEESIVHSLRQYRFEPLLGDGPEMHHATIIIRAGGVRP